MDNEWNNAQGVAGNEGTGNSYDYGFRIYDSRVARFLSEDPLTSGYPGWSPYAYAMNRVIDGIDLDGLEWTKKAYWFVAIASNLEEIKKYPGVSNCDNLLKKWMIDRDMLVIEDGVVAHELYDDPIVKAYESQIDKKLTNNNNAQSYHKNATISSFRAWD